MDPYPSRTPDGSPAPAEADELFVAAVSEVDTLADTLADKLATRVVRALSPQLNAAPRALLDLAGAAARLNVSQRTVEHLVAVGELPVVRLGLGRGVRRFEPAALDALVRRHTRTL